MSVDLNNNLSRRQFLRTAGLAGAAALSAPVFAGAPADPPDPEARYYETLDGNRVHCLLCPRECRVPPGKSGYCGVRVNRGGRYFSRVYGRPVAVNNDPIEKKPFFHVLPGSKALSIATVGCNIHCSFCQNWDISQSDPDDAHAPYRSPADIAALAAEHGSRTIACTYNEPTVFCEYVIDCARAARDRGIGSVVVSNGYISKTPLRDLCGVVTAVKVDLKAFTQKFYGEVCEGRLQPVLDTLKRLADSGVWYEVVVLLIPTLNDGGDEIKGMTGWIAENLGPDVPLHFTRFHPTYRLTHLPPTPPETLKRARDIALAAGLHYVYTGNTPGQSGENTFCPSCGAVVIKRYGFYLASFDLVAGACSACGARIPGVWTTTDNAPASSSNPQAFNAASASQESSMPSTGTSRTPTVSAPTAPPT
jgi:pyruvate formate lyase activating enzyme